MFGKRREKRRERLDASATVEPFGRKRRLGQTAGISKLRARSPTPFRVRRSGTIFRVLPE